MAKNEPNKPDEVKTAPAQEAAAEEKSTPKPMPEIGGKAPAPEKTAEETAALPHEDGAALHESDKDRPKVPTPIDIPAPGDVVVSFDKINEIVSGKQAAVKEAEQTAPEKKDMEKSAHNEKKAEPEKPGMDKGKENEPKTANSKPKSRSQKTTEKADKKPTRPAKQEKAPKAVKPEKPDKPKQAAEIGGGASDSPQATEQAQQETPSPAPELPSEPREAPRPGEQEQIVYLNLSELFAFKDHPFQVRNDEEMAAMVESVKDKGVTHSAAIRVLFFFLSLNITFHIYHLLIHVNVNSYMLIWYTITAISPFLAVLCHKIKQDNILAVLLSAGVISVMLLQIMSSNHDDMYCEIIFLICAIILMHKKLITTLISLCIGPAIAFFLYQMPFFS